MTTSADTDPSTAHDDSYRIRVRFTGPPDAVFDALTTTTGVAGWWTTRVTGSGSAGGELRIAFPNGDYEDVVLAVDTAHRPVDTADRPVDTAEPPVDTADRPVDTADRPGTVVWSVKAAPGLPAWAEWPGTRVVVRLLPDGTGGTTMTLHHEGLTPKLHCYDLCSGGWDYVLASLHDHVDSGTGRPIS